MIKLKRQDRLLIECLGFEGGLSRIDELKRLTASDWADVVQLSLRHRIAPQIYQGLKKYGLSTYVPADVFQLLRETYLHNAVRNTRRFHELSKVLKMLKREGVPVIVLKGAHLAEVVYEKIGMRSMSDVDLLFRKEDLSRAQEKLMATGYIPYSRRLPLDLHWNIDLSIAHLNIDIKKIWDRARPAFIGGVEVLVLCPEDLLLHLCIHLSFHHESFQFAGLRTFCDIREAIWCYNGQIEWKSIVKRAKKWGVGNAIYLTLSLVRDLLNVEMPDGDLDALKPDNFDRQLKIWALEKVLYSKDYGLSLSPYFWQLWKPGSFKEKAFHLQKLIFPAPEFVSQKYPSPYGSLKNYIYYIIRLKDHFFKYGRAMWRMMIRNEEMVVSAKQMNENITMREWLSSG